MKFGVRKLESWGYQMVKKIVKNRFDTIRRVTDGQTDGQADRRTRCDRYYPR